MDALMICGAVVALAVVTTVLWRTLRGRSAQRRQWLGTQENDWSEDELATLRSADAAA